VAASFPLTKFKKPHQDWLGNGQIMWETFLLGRKTQDHWLKNVRAPADGTAYLIFERLARGQNCNGNRRLLQKITGRFGRGLAPLG